MNNPITLLEQTKALIEIMEEPDNEIVKIKLNEALTNHADKIDRCVNYVKHQEYEIDWLKSEIKHIQDEIKKKEAGIQRIKERAKEVLHQLGERQIVGTKGHKFMESLYESIEILDINLVPEKYKTTEIIIKADKNLIKEDLRNGVDIRSITGIRIILNEHILVK